jgi:hypothetical protein
MSEKQNVFEQLSKEMAVFAQNNASDFSKLQKFFLYELELRAIPKRELMQRVKESYESRFRSQKFEDSNLSNTYIEVIEKLAEENEPCDDK